MNVILPSNFQMILGLYAYLLPLLLYVVWTTLALWDLGSRADQPALRACGWVFLILAVPFIGALGYLFLGGSRLAPRLKLVALGGAAAYVLVLVVGSLIGGIS